MSFRIKVNSNKGLIKETLLNAKVILPNDFQYNYPLTTSPSRIIKKETIHVRSTNQTPPKNKNKFHLQHNLRNPPLRKSESAYTLTTLKTKQLYLSEDNACSQYKKFNSTMKPRKSRGAHRHHPNPQKMLNILRLKLNREQLEEGNPYRPIATADEAIKIFKQSEPQHVAVRKIQTRQHKWKKHEQKEQFMEGLSGWSHHMKQQYEQ